MAESYFRLQKREQKEIIQQTARLCGQSPSIIEKDIWIAWVLDALFRYPRPEHLPPNQPLFAFKGGTSLSKAYGIIERFSEDVDITINYLAFNDHLTDPFQATRNQRKKFTERVNDKHLPQFVSSIKTHLEEQASSRLPDAQLEIVMDNDTLQFNYSPHNQPEGLLLGHILLEFGGRNRVTPTERVTITPIASEHVPNVTFTEATVDTLALVRTFWEKVTLAHDYSTRSTRPTTLERLSRHWFDLHCLYKSPAYGDLLSDTQIRDDVIHVKKCFFSRGGVDYEHCRNLQARLLPDQDTLDGLREDYEGMRTAAMIHGSQASTTFEHILESVEALQNDINS